MSLIYCYGIIENNLSLTITGFESNSIYLIPFTDINAVVSDVSENNFSQEIIDKNIKNMKWLVENGNIHEAVVDSVMKKTTVIPMKLCTVFKKKENVESMLKEKYVDFKFNLKNLEGKAEIGVKVYFNAEPLKQKILDESPEIKKLEKEAEKKSKGIAYFDKQKIELLIKERLHQKLVGSRNEIFNKLKDLAEDSKENELLNKKVTKKDMLLNAVFLINKKQKEQFKSNTKKIKLEYKDLEFEVWGPFPPYNFIK